MKREKSWRRMWCCCVLVRLTTAAVKHHDQMRVGRKGFGSPVLSLGRGLFPSFCIWGLCRYRALNFSGGQILSCSKHVQTSLLGLAVLASAVWAWQTVTALWPEQAWDLPSCSQGFWSLITLLKRWCCGCYSLTWNFGVLSLSSSKWQCCL